MEKVKLKTISGGGQEKPPVNEMNALLDKYACGLDAKPELLIYGRDHRDGHEIVHWIKPCNEQNMIAHKISKLINRQGGEARVITREEYENSADEISRDIVQNA